MSAESEVIDVIWEVIFDKSLLGKWHRRKMHKEWHGTVDKEGHLIIRYNSLKREEAGEWTRQLKAWPHVYKVLTTILPAL